MFDGDFVPSCGNRIVCFYFVSALNEFGSIFSFVCCYAEFRCPYGEAVAFFGNCLCFACKVGARFDFGFDFDAGFFSDFYCSFGRIFGLEGDGNIVGRNGLVVAALGGFVFIGQVGNDFVRRYCCLLVSFGDEGCFACDGFVGRVVYFFTVDIPCRVFIAFSCFSF